MPGSQKNPITILAGEALEPFRLVRFNGSAWVLCAATDTPDAVTLQSEAPSGNGISNAARGPARLLNWSGTIEVECSGTIVAGEQVYLTAGGKIGPTGTVPIGKALAAGANGGTCQIIANGMGGGAAGGGVVTAVYTSDGTPAATDTVFFVATRPYRVLSITEVHAVAAGGASALQVTKDTGTNAPGAGTDLLTNNTNTGFDLAATANTVQNGTLATTAGLTTLAAGDRLSVDYANAIQSTAGVVVVATLQPL